jgi:hypothetical protein
MRSTKALGHCFKDIVSLTEVYSAYVNIANSFVDAAKQSSCRVACFAIANIIIRKTHQIGRESFTKIAQI